MNFIVLYKKAEPSQTSISTYFSPKTPYATKKVAYQPLKPYIQPKRSFHQLI